MLPGASGRDPPAGEGGVRPIQCLRQDRQGGSAGLPPRCSRRHPSASSFQASAGLAVRPGRPRPLVQKIATPLRWSNRYPPARRAMSRLTSTLGVGCARSSPVLRLSAHGQGSIDSNLERLVDWAGERSTDKAPRHDFGVLQPTGAAINAIGSSRQQAARAAEQRVAGADHRSFRMPRAVHDPGAGSARRSSGHENRRP